MRWLALFLFLPSFALGQDRFVRACAIYADPSAIATKLCRKPAGEAVLDRRPSRDGFTRVETGDCLGYVRESCLTKAEDGGRRGPASDGGQGRDVRLGLAFQADSLFGRVPGVGGTEGLGFAVALLGQVSVSDRFRLVLKPAYQYVSLTRAINFSGVLTDPSQTHFSQNIPCLSAGLLASYRVLGKGEVGDNNDWWVDGGTEVLFPLSGRQTDSTNDSVATHPRGKFWLALLGLSTRFPLGLRWDLGGYAHAYYSIASKGASNFYGVRLGFALSARL